MILEAISVGPMQVNCYILASGDNSEAIIVDPGDEERKIRKVLEKHKLVPAFVINTHGHYDHIGCDDKFGVPVYVHKQDLALLKDPMLNLSGLFGLACSVKSKILTLEDNQIIELGDIKLRVMHLPGHSPGGIGLLMLSPDEKIVFTGDSLFYRGIGRTDMAGGNQASLIKSIKEKLFPLSADTLVYPGHGPSSTIGEEKQQNPFFT